VPPLTFGVVPLIGTVLCLLLPETANAKLPDTLEEGENFGKYVQNSSGPRRHNVIHYIKRKTQTGKNIKGKLQPTSIRKTVHINENYKLKFEI
jgi:hypothetical protein